MSTSLYRMFQRRGTKQQWETINPVLAVGEIGFSFNENVIKVGDGLTAWNSLPSVNGNSAYQIAKINGFAGTEAQWLASLVGPQGATGPAGADSTVPGPTGPTGPTGATGPMATQTSQLSQNVIPITFTGQGTTQVTPNASYVNSIVSIDYDQAVTINIGTSLNTIMQNGQYITFVVNHSGENLPQFVATGVTMRSFEDKYFLAGPGATAQITKLSNNNYILSGRLG